jgi:hypothetical protein
MLFEDHCFEEALKWSLKGASDETSPSISSYVGCQTLTALIYSHAYSNFRLARFWTMRVLDHGPLTQQEKQKITSGFLEETEQNIWKQCGSCKKASPQVRCGSCQGVAYCDQACQQKDWKRHKKLCKDVPKILTKEDVGIID